MPKKKQTRLQVDRTSRSRRDRRGSRRLADSSPDSLAAGWSPLFLLVQFLIAALLVARLLIPAEASVHGETLWLVQLWLAAAGLWAWDALRRGDFRIRLGWCDAALAVLAAGHVVSAVAVVVDRDGDQRAAINLAWEWIGLATAFFLLRQTVRTSIDGRRVLLVMTVTAGSLAGLGLYQHHVWYPQIAARYDDVRGELDSLVNGAAPASAAEAARREAQIRRLQTELVQQGVPLDAFEGPTRMTWENRLRSSTEPFGLFALANTFAGLLVVWLVIAAAVTFESVRQRAGWRTSTGPALIAGLLLYCLILTKSRTAWVGLAAGLAVWGWLRLRSARASKASGGREPPETSAGSRRPLASPVIRWTVVVGILAGSLAALALFSGGLDREVISETPKSLRYRLQYWAGAAEVIRERPLLGTGPGNFRAHYLKHKRPESSEEIADPHNILLDVWTSGGLVAVVGLLGLLLAGWRAFRPSRPGDSDVPRFSLARLARDPFVIGAAGGFALVFGAEGLLGNGWDARLPILLAGAGLLLLAAARAFHTARLSTDCLAGAAVALLVHLLGAGGAEMPAIGQTLLVLLAVGTVLNGGSIADRGLRIADSNAAAVASTRQFEIRNPQSAIRNPQSAIPHVALIASLVVAATLFAACAATASAPVLQRRASVSLGDDALQAERNLRKAEALYRQAARHDPFSPEPLERLAALSFHRWARSPTASDEDFQQAVELQRLAIELDPHAAARYQRLGQWHLSRFDRSKAAEDARQAVAAFREAVRRYPNYAPLRADLAEALHGANEHGAARSEAAAAIRLDEINRREGHRDKYLPPPARERLERLSSDL